MILMYGFNTLEDYRMIRVNVILILSFFINMLFIDAQVNAESNQKNKEVITIDNKQMDGDAEKEGDISSKERWVRVQKNLADIKQGMDKNKVIELIGYPDFIRWVPKNIMQYTVADGVMNDKQTATAIHIIIDSDQKVVSVEINAAIYGPPPQ